MISQKLNFSILMCLSVFDKKSQYLQNKIDLQKINAKHLYFYANTYSFKQYSLQVVDYLKHG